MAPPGNDSTAIRGKSLALIEKTLSNISQLDEKKFPTKSSNEAKQLIHSALSSLAKQENLNVVSPEVLYSQLFQIQDLVKDIEASIIDRISWPIVSYCDEIRDILFDQSRVNIFYSLTREHNYMIAPFSQSLRTYLKDLLPSKELDQLFSGPEIYCLSLASLEDDNLPLYANIGHEFGHALFSQRQTELAGMFTPIFEPLLIKAQETLDKGMALELIRMLFMGQGQELYCDLVGSLLMGPAFLLSAYEMSWGDRKNTWSGDISLRNGYPSWNFRLASIKKWIGLDDFLKDARLHFAKLESPKLQKIPDFFAAIPSEHAQEDFLVTCDAKTDIAPSQEFLVHNLKEIKDGFERFLDSCKEKLQEDYQGKLRTFQSSNITELLHRLECDILPNIIPNKTLLGIPAEFHEILNASAVFRTSILIDGLPPGEIGMRTTLQKVERLTSKALEVSYIQMKYAKR